MAPALSGISSMATRNALAELAANYAQQAGQKVEILSIGGVTAADRIRAGEKFDFVVLARDALQKLDGEGHLVAGSLVDIARSPMALAVRAGAPHPPMADEAAFRAIIESAASIGLSTGPSGTYLQKLLAKWGLTDLMAKRLIQAPPGVPVAALVARGEAAIGVQQLSELAGAPGIDVVGELPAAIQSITTFSAAICAKAQQKTEAQAILRFLISPQASEAKRRNGLQ